MKQYVELNETERLVAAGAMALVLDLGKEGLKLPGNLGTLQLSVSMGIISLTREGYIQLLEKLVPTSMEEKFRGR